MKAVVELFTVLMSEKEKIVTVNEDILKLYGLTQEEFNKKWDKQNLIKAIRDFINTLEQNNKMQ